VEEVRKGRERLNTVQILYIHMYVNGEVIPIETIPGMVAGGIKENNGGGEFKYDIFDIL
jgi:hypothetical protein